MYSITNVCIYVYIYIYIYNCLCIYIYTYVYTHLSTGGSARVTRELLLGDADIANNSSLFVCLLLFMFVVVVLCMLEQLIVCIRHTLDDSSRRGCLCIKGMFRSP